MLTWHLHLLKDQTCCSILHSLKWRNRRLRPLHGPPPCRRIDCVMFYMDHSCSFITHGTVARSSGVAVGLVSYFVRRFTTNKKPVPNGCSEMELKEGLWTDWTDWLDHCLCNLLQRFRRKRLRCDTTVVKRRIHVSPSRFVYVESRSTTLWISSFHVASSRSYPFSPSSFSPATQNASVYVRQLMFSGVFAWILFDIYW